MRHVMLPDRTMIMVTYDQDGPPYEKWTLLWFDSVHPRLQQQLALGHYRTLEAASKALMTFISQYLPRIQPPDAGV